MGEKMSSTEIRAALEDFIKRNECSVLAGANDDRKSFSMMWNVKDAKEAIFILSNAMIESFLNLHKENEGNEYFDFNGFLSLILELIEMKVKKEV